MAYRRDELRFNGWGLRRRSVDLRGRDAEVWALVRDMLRMDVLPDTPASDLDAVMLPRIRLSDDMLAQLRAATSDSAVHTDAYERAFHSVGKSYYDMIRIRAGSLSSAPDAVVYPANHGEVAAVLALCAEQGISVVPFGGGSSVVGGVEASGGQGSLITLDTTRMTRLLDLDTVSHTATFESGIYGPELEEELGQRGFTLGHFPQSFEFSTLGGWIAARGAGQQSNRYGGAAKLLVGARLATPEGEWRTSPFPASAAGPDLNHLIAGSEGILGVITEATVKIHRKAEARDFISFLFKGWEAGVDAVRRLTQAGIPTSTLRLSDVGETRFYTSFKQALKPSRAQDLGQKALGVAGYDEPCVLMVGFEGGAASVRLAWRQAFAMATKAGGVFVGRGPGNSWYENRFEMPYLRDPLMDHGVGIDTLETSTTWSNVPRLYAAVGDAIRGAMADRGNHGVVLTHLSHTYVAGTSLYFTFLFPRDTEDEVGQWRQLKNAASQAIADNGGTISHHHGVGVDHTPWMTEEKGPLGMSVVEAAKRAVDPSGIMNPGKVLPGKVLPGK